MAQITKPLTDKGRTTRDRIIEAAATLVSARGVGGTSVDAVLEAAAAGKSQLYHYFGDKHGLVRAVIDYRNQTVIRPQLDALDSMLTWEDLREWFDSAAEHQAATGCQEGCPVGSLASELSARDEEGRAALATAFGLWEQHFAAALERFRSAGLVRQSADVDALASTTLATVQGALLLARTTRDPRRLKTTLDQAFLYLRAHATD